MVAVSKSHLAHFIQMYRLYVLIYHEYCRVLRKVKGEEIWCKISEKKEGKAEKDIELERKRENLNIK